MTRALLLMTLALAACSTVPNLDARISESARNAEYPTLKPIDEVLSNNRPARLDDSDAARFQTRVARLKARAARLRRTPVVDRSARDRLHQAIRG